MKEFSRMNITADMICDTMVNNVLVFGPDGKVFFCEGAGRMGPSLFVFSCT